MRHVAAIVILTASVAGVCLPAHARDQRPAPINPCKSDFTLSVTVNAVDGIDTWPVGFKISYKAGASRGIASRVQTDDSSEFGAAQCNEWQKRNWADLRHIIFQSKDPETQRKECINIATIKYQLGSQKAEQAQICLGPADEDSNAATFKRFFESTDGMVLR